MRLTRTVIGLIALVTAGCMGEDPFETGRREASPEALGVVVDADSQAAAESASPSPEPDAEETSDGTAPASGPSTKPDASTAGHETPPPPAARKKAAVGVGKKGHYGGAGIVKTPVSVYFRAQERIIFNIQIPKQMQLYKAINGKAPQSHQEFMEKIIKACHINLPTLVEGERYLYDPEKEELFIEQPAR